MPIVRLKTDANPYAPIAWQTSVAALTLEKLRKWKHPRLAELEALQAVGTQMDLFSKAAQSDLDDVSEEPRLRSSFFALRAIRGESRTPPIKPPQFKKAGEDIRAIHDAYMRTRDPKELDRNALDAAQDLCLELLEHLNKLRPNPSLR